MNTQLGAIGGLRRALDLIAPDGRKADRPSYERRHYLSEMQESAHGRNSAMGTKRNNRFVIALKLFMVTVVAILGVLFSRPAAAASDKADP